MIGLSRESAAGPRLIRLSGEQIPSVARVEDALVVNHSGV
jgi:hypothetical protein